MVTLFYPECEDLALHFKDFWLHSAEMHRQDFLFEFSNFTC